jgi:hypothetical protein
MKGSLQGAKETNGFFRSLEGAFHKTHPASIPCLLLLTGNSLF